MLLWLVNIGFAGGKLRLKIGEVSVLALQPNKSILNIQARKTVNILKPTRTVANLQEEKSIKVLQSLKTVVIHSAEKIG